MTEDENMDKPILIKWESADVELDTEDEKRTEGYE
jgi:hypothetical protein